MRAFVFTVASLALWVAVSSSPVQSNKKNVPVVKSYKSGEKCPAQNFYIECNLCVCDFTGYNAACTQMGCLSANENLIPKTRSLDLPHIDIFEQIGQCNPNEHFYDKCNVCQCGPDGKGASCTLMECPQPERVHFDGYQQGQKCVAGKQFFDDCNTCTCNEDGVSAACTLMECPKSQKRQLLNDRPHIDNFSEVNQCTPGEIFYDKCNTCRCAPDGISAACTKMGCEPVEKPHIDGYKSGNNCPAGKTFYNRCNECHCNLDGKSAVCTLKGCL